MPPKEDKKKKQTYFDKAWLNDPSYSTWLKSGSNSTTFRCKVCPDKKNGGERTLGDMGVGALKKHAKSEGHKGNLKQFLSTLSFFQPRSTGSVSNSDSQGPVARTEIASEVTVTISSNVHPVTSSGVAANPDPIIPCSVQH